MVARLLRLPEVEERTGLKRATIYKKQRAGTFPRGVKITAVATAWREDEIDRWMESLPAACTSAAAAAVRDMVSKLPAGGAGAAAVKAELQKARGKELRRRVGRPAVS